MGMLAELKRRKVFNVAAGYAVVGWLVIEVAATIAPQLNFPEWVPRLITLLILLGFPVALVMAWIFEVTPEGVKLDAKASGSKRVFVGAAVLAVLALGWYLHDRVLPTPTATATIAAARTTSAAAAAAAAAAAPAESIAVLPFVNMSADPDNVYFSDGLSEEILNSLARIDGMQVVGRTSSFQFKGRNEDLRVIGEKLGVASVLEGSVRREGDKARITAQLIRTSDGIHLWSQTYDRTLKDTLAVQLDIAEQVAAALNVVLDEKQREVMRKAGVRNVDAFIAYQKGLKLYDDAHSKPEIGLLQGLRLANAEFARATTLEPDFHEPYFAAADLYEHTLQADGASEAERIEAQREALKTLGLAAGNSRDEQQRLLTLAEQQMLSDDWHGLSANIDAAFKAPGCHASNWLPVFASAFGYGDAIEDFGKRASACDPLNFINYGTRISVALATGHPQRALDILATIQKARGGVPSTSQPARALALAMLGRVAEAGKLLDAVEPEQRNESYVMARAIVGRARGETPAVIRASVQGADRKQSKYKQWTLADAVVAANAGNRVEANRIAASFDARPGGGLLLALFTEACHCGAPFDLDATPNFKARLAESGLRWPPPATIKSPPPAQAGEP